MSFLRISKLILALGLIVCAIMLGIDRFGCFSRDTAFLRCVENGDLSGARALHLGGVSIDATDLSGRTALRIAIDAHNHEVLDYLTTRYPNADIRDRERRAPLHASVENECEVCVRAILRCKCNPDIQDGSRDTPLTIAARRADSKIIAALLSANADPNKWGWMGQPLFFSVQRQDSISATSLLRHGASPNSRHGMLDTPALNVASANGDYAMAALLIKNGADVWLTDGRGRTALREAYDAGNTSLADMLRTVGAAQDEKAAIETNAARKLSGMMPRSSTARGSDK